MRVERLPRLDLADDPAGGSVPPEPRSDRPRPTPAAEPGLGPGAGDLQPSPRLVGAGRRPAAASASSVLVGVAGSGRGPRRRRRRSAAGPGSSGRRSRSVRRASGFIGDPRRRERWRGRSGRIDDDGQPAIIRTPADDPLSRVEIAGSAEPPRAAISRSTSASVVGGRQADPEPGRPLGDGRRADRRDQAAPIEQPAADARRPGRIAQDDRHDRPAGPDRRASPSPGKASRSADGQLDQPRPPPGLGPEDLQGPARRRGGRRGQAGRVDQRSGRG